MNVQDYYLGIILPDETYFQNPKHLRLFEGDVYDPFYGMPQMLSMVVGNSTLLHKIGDTYYDEYFSRYRNELSYIEGESNSLGIVLAYVKPFTDYYKEKPTVYIQEEIEDNLDLLEQIAENHTYYIAHSKITKKEALVILDEEPMKLLYNNYIQSLKQKILTKK